MQPQKGGVFNGHLLHNYLSPGGPGPPRSRALFTFLFHDGENIPVPALHPPDPVRLWWWEISGEAGFATVKECLCERGSCPVHRPKGLQSGIFSLPLSGRQTPCLQSSQERYVLTSTHILLQKSHRGNAFVAPEPTPFHAGGEALSEAA